MRAVDAAELWDTRGATSMAAWLAEHGRMPRGRATRLVTTARRVGRLPVTDAAWHRGTLSTGQVETICSFLTEALVEVFARHEGELVPALAPLTVADLAAAMRAWRAAADDPDPGADSPGELHASRTLDGRVRVDGHLDGEPGDLLLTALRVAGQAAADDAEDAPGTSGRRPAERRADALGDICRFFLDHQRSVPEGGRHRPHVNVVVHLEPDTDAGGVDVAADRTSRDRRHQTRGPVDARPGRLFGVGDAHTVDGHPVDRVTAGRYLCDSLLYRVLMQGRSAVIDHGRATRAVPPPLWNALLLRDRHCRVRGCDRPGHWCEAHHVVPWEAGGETNLANLACVCTRHHHVLHRPGWHASLDPDGTFHVTDPWGTTRTTRPPGAGPPLPFA